MTGKAEQGGGDYIIDPRLDKDTADRLRAVGVNHLQNVGKQEFVAGMKPTSIKNTSDRAIIASQVSRYAASSKVNFVAEVFAGKCAGKRYGRDILRLYKQMGGPS